MKYSLKNKAQADNEAKDPLRNSVTMFSLF